MLFFFNDTAPTEIYTLSLHDALPILLKLAVPLGIDRLLVAGTVSRPPRITPPVQVVAQETAPAPEPRSDLELNVFVEKLDAMLKFAVPPPTISAQGFDSMFKSAVLPA